MKNEKFEKEVKEYKEKQSDKKERYLSVAYVLSFFVGYLWEVVVSILPIESTALAVFIAVVGAAVSLLLAFAVYYPIMCLLTDIKTNTWITAHKDDFDEDGND